MDTVAVNRFVVDTMLVSPIRRIIGQLDSGDFRDCDIVWLDNKLHGFVEIAGSTLGINVAAIHVSDYRKPVLMNDYATGYYKDYFGRLLDYFVFLNED